MCILFVNVDPNPEKGAYRLVLATNRDEYYRRPSLPVHVDKNNIIGGKDMEPGREGGTWLAFRTKDQYNGKGKKHCIGVLLNVTGTLIENPKSRGRIILDYLLSNKSFPEYSEMLEKSIYNGYNFVSVELSEENSMIYHHGNVPNVNSSYVGKHNLGFGNSPIFSPLTKVTRGRHTFEEILKRNLSKEDLQTELFKLLKDETRHLPDDELQRRQPLAYEILSSIFYKVDPPGYGTRTHTLILIDYDWNLSFIEETMCEPIDKNNPQWKRTQFDFKL